MCTVNEKINQIIENLDISIQDIADNSLINYKTLYNIRTGKQSPKADHTLSIAKTLDTPELIRYHCQTCDIGKRFHLMHLNGNIRDQGHDILMKNQIEATEFLEVSPAAFKILFEKNEYSSEEVELIKKALHEAFDIKHSVQTLEDWYANRFGIENLEKEISEHHQKCFDRGYIIK